MKFLAALLLLPCFAFAAPPLGCMPGLKPYGVGANAHGVWAWVFCDGMFWPLAQRWADGITFEKLGGRAETVRNNPNPPQAFVDSWNRHVTLSIDDERFRPILADMCKQQAEMTGLYMKRCL